MSSSTTEVSGDPQITSQIITTNQAFTAGKNLRESLGLPITASTITSPDGIMYGLPLLPEKHTVLTPDQFGNTLYSTGSSLERGDRKFFESISGIFDHWKGAAQERVLFVLPHDDDAIIGMGMTMRKLREAGVQIDILITTDGSMGYDDINLHHNNKIVDVRKEETLNAHASVGITSEHLHFLNFPDTKPHLFGGRTSVTLEHAGLVKDLLGSGVQPQELEGYVGLENSYVHYLRSLNPTRVFTPHGEDLHPDHQEVYNRLIISIYHSMAKIWPELGKPLVEVPNLYKYAVYCDYPKGDAPDHHVEGTTKDWARKLVDIGFYKSQEGMIGQIMSRMDDPTAQISPTEHFLSVNPAMFEAGKYSRGVAVNNTLLREEIERLRKVN